MMIRKVRREDSGGRPFLRLEIDGVPGVVLDEQRRLHEGWAVVSGEAASLFPSVRAPGAGGSTIVIRDGGTDDPELVRLVWDFMLSNVAEEDRHLLAKPPRAVLDTPIDNRWFEE